MWHKQNWNEHIARPWKGGVKPGTSTCAFPVSCEESQGFAGDTHPSLDQSLWLRCFYCVWRNLEGRLPLGQSWRSRSCEKVATPMWMPRWRCGKWKWSRSVMPDSATPWTVARQAPLAMGCSRQECWSGLPFPSPGDLFDPRIKPGSPALAGRFFTVWATREAYYT